MRIERQQAFHDLRRPLPDGEFAQLCALAQARAAMKVQVGQQATQAQRGVDVLGVQGGDAMAGELETWREGIAALSSSAVRTALPECFIRTQTGDLLVCKGGLTCVKGGAATETCLTVSQSLGPRKWRVTGFIRILQGVPCSPTR